jgi:hypothetical protein
MTVSKASVICSRAIPSRFVVDRQRGVTLADQPEQDDTLGHVGVYPLQPAARTLADIYLPKTKAEFGRASKPRSHRLYRAPSALAAGLLRIDDLKNSPGTACTLVGRVEQSSPLADMGRADIVLPDGSTIIEIPRSVIEALIFLHRYLRFDQRDDVRAILAALDRLGRRLCLMCSRYT